MALPALASSQYWATLRRRADRAALGLSTRTCSVSIAQRHALGWHVAWCTVGGGTSRRAEPLGTSPRCFCSLGSLTREQSAERRAGENATCALGTSNTGHQSPRARRAEPARWHRYTQLSPSGLSRCFCIPSASFWQACHARALRL